MAEIDIFSQAKQDLADVFRIVAERGEKQPTGWYQLDDIATADNQSARFLMTPEGTVTEPKSKDALLEFREAMSMKKLHELAERLRGQAKP